MAQLIRMTAGGPDFNWNERPAALTIADEAEDVRFSATEISSYTPNKAEIAVALKRTIAYLVSNEGGDWPLA